MTAAIYKEVEKPELYLKERLEKLKKLIEIASSKGTYYDALRCSQYGWHEGPEDVFPFIKYMLGTILAACKDFGDRFPLWKKNFRQRKWFVKQHRI